MLGLTQSYVLVPPTQAPTRAQPVLAPATSVAPVCTVRARPRRGPESRRLQAVVSPSGAVLDLPEQDLNDENFCGTEGRKAVSIAPS
jgi:hypothetical protein